jgi:hypothetical protein
MLDADLLNEATRILGPKTYSATVNRALAEALRIHKIQTLPTFFLVAGCGKVTWRRCGRIASRDHKIPVWHKDRDFETIARLTSLQTKSYS